MQSEFSGLCHLSFVLAKARCQSYGKEAPAMTPQPPSSTEGSSLQPRHRPTLSTFAHDTTEVDLWDFDEEAESPTASEEPLVEGLSRSAGRDIPAPREAPPEKTRQSGDALTNYLPTGGSEQIRININKGLTKNRLSAPSERSAISKDAIDDIEDWDQLPEPTVSDVPPAAFMPDLFDPAIPAEPVRKNAGLPEIPQTPEATVEPKDDSPPVARSKVAALPPSSPWKLSSIERLGLILLLLILLAGGGAIVIFSSKRLPTEAPRAKANDFPIKGAYLTVDSAVSYWRAPIRDGATVDVVRRGTRLLPVLEVTAHGGPAAIRVYFRNEDHAVVGDAVTKTVSGGSPVQIPATAGFDDLGMHAAYRTGESKPWIIEVFEAPAENSPGNAFRKLFELNISTDRR